MVDSVTSLSRVSEVIIIGTDAGFARRFFSRSFLTPGVSSARWIVFAKISRGEIAARMNGCTPFSRGAVYINTGLHVPLRGKRHFRATGNLLFRFRISRLIATGFTMRANSKLAATQRAYVTTRVNTVRWAHRRSQLYFPSFRLNIGRSVGVMKFASSRNNDWWAERLMARTPRVRSSA